MADIIVPRDTVHAFKLEATEGTAPTDVAADATIPEVGASLTGFSKQWVDDNSQLGHFGHLHPHDGGPAEPGQTVQFKVHGSGTHGTAPEIGQYLQCSFGVQSASSGADTVAASPAPSTSGFTLTSGAALTVPVGHLADIEVTTDTYETRRVLTNASGAITFWPPTSAAATALNDVYGGVAYLLTSTQSSMKSGTGFWYFNNGEKCVLSGLRGNVVFTATIRQPLMAEFTMQGIKAPVVAPAALGYTPAPVGYGTAYPMVRGIFLKSYIPAAVGGSASTTSIPLTYKNASYSASEFTFYGTGSTPVGVDKLIVDVGSSVYETKPIQSFDYATQTITLAGGNALSGSPAQYANAYIEHQTCLPDTLTFDVGHVFTRLDCAQEDDTWSGQRLTDRMVRVSWSEYFREFMQYNITKNSIFTELWCIVGSARGNKIAICAPNVFRQEYELDLGGDFGMVSINAGSYTQSVAGNDELYLTFL